MPLPVLPPLAGLLAGAAAGLTWPDLPVSVLVAMLVTSSAMAALAVCRAQRTLLAIATASAFAVGGAALSVDAWHLSWRSTLRLVFESVARTDRREAVRAGRFVPEDDSALMVVVGRLRADASLTDSGAISLPLDVEWAGRVGSPDGRADPATNPVKGGVLLTVVGVLGPAAMEQWRAGRVIRTAVELRRPSRYLDPGVPDQERALARRGITLVGTVKSAALVETVAAGSLLDEVASSARAFVRRAVAQHVGRWSPRAAGIVNAIVIGDRTGLESEVERRLQEAGTYHVIAISGGNIAILAGLTLALFRLAGMLGARAMLSAAVGLVVYGFIVGGGASVERAVLMAVLYFVGRAWDFKSPPAQAIVLAALILVSISPLSVVDPASLLTFGATAAIIATAPAVARLGTPTPLTPAIGLLLASLATELVLLPVSATLFSRVTFAGVALNFAAIPLMALAQLAGMAVVVLHGLVPGAANLVGWLAFIGADGLVRASELVQWMPWSTWRVRPPAWPAIWAYYLALVAAWSLRRRDGATPSAWSGPTRLSAFVLAFVTGVWIAVSPTSLRARFDGRLHLTFVDVGQGDATLIRTPRGTSLLVDAGGLSGSSTFDVGDRVVGPLLRHLGVTHLGSLALTHGDADHIGGALTMLREFRPWDVWEGIPVPGFEPLQRLRADAAAAGARWTTVQRGDTMLVDGVEIRVVHPLLADWERQKVRNDDSIVLELRWQDVSVVLTGDIGRDTEAEISALFEPAPLRVIKVPHHGSITSSSESFVDALAPDVAIVSVGRGNTFGHPSPTVLRRYEAVGAAIFRTDRDGAIEVDADGHELEVSTFTGRGLRIGARSRAGHENALARRDGVL